MRKIIFAVLLLLLCCDIAGAGNIGLGITDALTDIVSGGISKFFIFLADLMYSMSYSPAGHEFNGTSTEVFIYSLTTHTADPWAVSDIQDFRKNTLVWLILFGSVYSLIGFIYVAWAIARPESADVLDGMLNRSSSYRKKRMKEYFESLLVYVLAVSITDLGVKMLFTLNFFLTSLFLVSSMEMHSLTPSPDNMILYFAMGLCYFVLSGFMLVREIFLSIFVMISFLIALLIIPRRTRHKGISIFYYFVGILFFQSGIVLLTTTGYIAAKGICHAGGTFVGVGAELVIYTALLLILVICSFIGFISLIIYRRKAVRTVKMVM